MTYCVSDNTDQTYALESSMGFLSRRLSRAMGRRLTENFIAAGLQVSIDQWLLLVCIYHRDGQNQQCIGEFCGKDRASVTRLIDQMEREGYIVRRSDPHDRRNNRIHSTEAGQEFTRRLMRIAQQTQEESLQGIGIVEAEACRDTLRRMLVNLEAE